MKIYFAAAISAGRKYAPIYKEIVIDLKKEGHQVLTEHVADLNVLNLELNRPAPEVYERDIKKLRMADLMVAEVSKPSTGVGYEIAYMLALQKPVICLYLKSLIMSKMITGNSDPLCSVYSYESTNELLDKLPEWVKKINRRWTMDDDKIKD